MSVDEIITQLDGFVAKLYVRTSSGVEPADPVTLSANLLLIRGLLVQLTPHLAELDKTARLTKAGKFDALLKAGEKKSPAHDALKNDQELIKLESDAERVKLYAKYVDGLCTAVQSVLRVQAGSDKSQY